MAIQDSDLFLVNRIGYPQITPQIGPIIDVGLTTGVNYSEYAQIWDLKNDTEYTGDYQDNADPDLTKIFDGDESTSCYAVNAPDQVWLGFKFTPPHPIVVEGLIEIKGGFHLHAQDGELVINGEVVLELAAYDLDPVWFSVSYTGEIHTIELRQINLPPDKFEPCKTFSINAFKVDGEYLIDSQQVTYLEFADNTDFDKFNLFDQVKECDASGNLLDATGSVGEVLPAQNRITLTQQEPNWDIGSYVLGRTQDDTTAGALTQTSHHVRADELRAKMLDNDLMLVNRIGYPQITPQIGPIIDVGLTTGVDYAQYVQFWDLKTDSEYIFAPGEEPDAGKAFDGDETTSCYAAKGPDSWIGFRFTPPHPIVVEGLIEIKGGFHDNARQGQLLINGEVVIELDAWDLEPKWFSASYKGEIETIEFQQTNAPTVGEPIKTFAVNAFKVDGEYLISGQQVTYLEFGSNTDFDKFNLFDHIKECNASGNLLDATGTVGEVLPAQNRITLTREEDFWDIGSYVQGRTYEDTTGTFSQRSYKANRAAVFESRAIIPTDLLLVNRGGASFHCTGEDFYEYHAFYELENVSGIVSGEEANLWDSNDNTSVFFKPAVANDPILVNFTPPISEYSQAPFTVVIDGDAGDMTMLMNGGNEIILPWQHGKQEVTFLGLDTFDSLSLSRGAAAGGSGYLYSMKIYAQHITTTNQGLGLSEPRLLTATEKNISSMADRDNMWNGQSDNRADFYAANSGKPVIFQFNKALTGDSLMIKSRAYGGDAKFIVNEYTNMRKDKNLGTSASNYTISGIGQLWNFAVMCPGNDHFRIWQVKLDGTQIKPDQIIPFDA